MTVLELRKLLECLPQSSNVYLQPMAKDVKRPCRTIVNGSTGIILTARAFSAGKGGRR